MAAACTQQSSRSGAVWGEPWACPLCVCGVGGDNSQDLLSCSSLTLGKTCAGKTPGWAAEQAIAKGKRVCVLEDKGQTEVVVVTGQQEGERILEGAGLMTSGWKIPGPDAGA